MLSLIGSLISAGAGLLGANSAQDSAERQAALANKWSRKSYKLEARRQDRYFRQNVALQKQFAKQGIRWRVRDAKRAGIHPLYAIGANTAPYSPVSTAGLSRDSYTGVSGGSGEALAAAGQEIGRGISAMQTPAEKISERLTLENMSLQNDLLRVQIATQAALRVGTGPGMPGHTDPGLIPEDPNHNPRPQLRIGGKWATSPYVSSGQDIQQRYGDEGPISWVAGVPALAADVLLNLGVMNDAANRDLDQRVTDQIQYGRR